MSATETWTVGRLLTWTTDFLKKHGSHSPRLDAEVLLAEARKCQRIELYTSFDEEPSDQIKTAFRELVRRRAEGTPVAYLVGHKEFYSADFEVTPDVLIPRPETEHLVVEALDACKTIEQPLMIADVGTGSGIIAITMAKHVPGCRVIATDVSEPALEVARRNAGKHGVSSQIDFHCCDLLPDSADEETFDLVLSNPPYISEDEFQQLESTVKDYEPRGALVGGQLGFELLQKLLQRAHPLLKNDGQLMFEFSPMLESKLEHFVGPEWASPQVVKDLAGLARIVCLSKVS